MQITETERLLLRYLRLSDAVFILELLNEPSWIKYIGDKGVKTIADAENYIRKGPMDMYKRLGFGLFAVDLKETGEPVGISGLIKRDTLDDVDIGFAFLKRFWRKGFAIESAAGVMEFAKDVVGLQRVVAITSKNNDASGKLLVKLGFSFEKLVILEEGNEELKYYSIRIPD